MTPSVPMAARMSARALWLARVALALVFVSAGAMKLVRPVDALDFPVAVSAEAAVALGLAELVGAAGLLLPGLFGRAPWVACTATAGLMLIVLAAAVTTAVYQDWGRAVFPAVVAAGCAAVLWADRRRRVAQDVLTTNRRPRVTSQI